MQLTLAQTSTLATTSTSPSPPFGHKSTLKPSASLNKKLEKKTSGSYKKCIGEKIRELTDEMRSKKKEAFNEFKVAYKNATSTEAKKEVRKNYNQKLKEINKWFNQEIRQTKKECRNLKSSNSSSPATSTSQ